MSWADMIAGSAAMQVAAKPRQTRAFRKKEFRIAINEYIVKRGKKGNWSW
jgi:hypothetical protein